MKTRAIKLISVILSAVIAASFSLSVSAATNYEKLSKKELKSGTSYEINLTKKNDDNTYKIIVAEKTTLALSFESEASTTAIRLFDSSGSEIDTKESKLSFGSKSSSKYVYWDVAQKKSKAVYTYSLLKGTYYFQFSKVSDYKPAGHGGNIFKFSAKWTDAPASLVVYYPLEVGDSITLTSSIADSTWTSSNEKVATVSSSGKVKAVKEGKVSITAASNGKKFTAYFEIK